MTDDLVAQWLSALRSGRYRQTRGFLKLKVDEPGCMFHYCCLGVLREISEQAGHPINRAYTSDHLDDYEAEKIVGLSYEDQRRLSRMNDDGASFQEIADWLELNKYTPGYGFAAFRAATLSALDVPKCP